jgi:crotonobetainyl-CoA:carnitine CoA-transferase CaiB-like acyl-CoA transferase
VINLKSDAGRATFLELVRCSDVVVDNFRPGVMTRLGIDYSVLKATNPRIIHCSITGFGPQGEYKNYPAFDIIIQALSGYMAITGEPDRPPVRLGVPLADLSGGLFSCQGILAALFERERTGNGKHMDLAIFDAMLSMLTYMGTMWLSNGELPKPPGSAHEYSVPWQAFKTEDSYVVVATREEKVWLRFCAAISDLELAVDSRFSSNASRVRNRDLLIPLLESVMLKNSTAYWLKAFREHEVPAGPVNHLDGAFSEPPVFENSSVVEYFHPDAGLVKMPAYPVKTGSGEPNITTPAPRLGQHTDEVLNGILFYSREKIADLKRTGAVANYKE